MTNNYPRATSRAAGIRVNLGMCRSVGNILDLPVVSGDNYTYIPSSRDSGLGDASDLAATVAEWYASYNIGFLELFLGVAGICLLGALAL